MNNGKITMQMILNSCIAFSKKINTVPFNNN